MADPDIKACILIESPADESEDQFRAQVTELLAGIYGEIPDWLKFGVGRPVCRRDRQFREFICVAGSVSLQIILHASRSSGISRTIITYGSSLNGSLVSTEIRGGLETKFDPNELRVG